MKKLEDKYILALGGVICIAVIECVSLVMGYNNQALITAVGAIGGIAGGAVGWVASKAKGANETKES